MKNGKSENNWGSFDCGKIFYWNKIPVITYCAALTRRGGEKGGEWRQFGTKLSPSENQQSFLRAGKYLLNALAISRLWFALGIPHCKCHCVHTAVPPWGCRPAAVAAAWGNRSVFTGGREGWPALAAFLDESSAAGLGSALSGTPVARLMRGNAQGRRVPGAGERGSTAGLALEVSTTLPKAPRPAGFPRSLFHHTRWIWECECPLINVVH